MRPKASEANKQIIKKQTVYLEQKGE